MARQLGKKEESYYQNGKKNFQNNIEIDKTEKNAGSSEVIL